MTDYTELTKAEQVAVDIKIVNDVEAKHHINESNGFEWDEPQWTLLHVHNGDMCSECLMMYYNCLCSHEDYEC